MSDMWNNCFSFVLVKSRQPVFQNCKETLSAQSYSLVVDVPKQTLKSYLSLFIIFRELLLTRTCHSMGMQGSYSLNFQVANCKVSLSVILMCDRELRHVNVNIMFPLHRNRYAYLKVPTYKGSIFDCIMHFGSCLISLALIWYRLLRAVRQTLASCLSSFI